MADYPEVAERIKKRFEFYLAPSNPLMNMFNDSDFLMTGTAGDTPLTAAEKFVVAHLANVTRYEKIRTLNSVRVWKNLEGNSSYNAGVLDCDFQMMSAKNQVGSPKITSSSYKVVLQIFGTNLSAPSSFICNLNDWSIPQNPYSTIQGSYKIGSEEATKYQLIPNPSTPAREQNWQQREPRSRTA